MNVKIGGALTIAACVKGDSVIDSGVSFYGIPPLELADAANLKIPMQFHFGNNDHSKGYFILSNLFNYIILFYFLKVRFSDKEAADGLKAKLVENKVDVSEFYQYEGADHAFMNEDEPHFKFNEAIAKQAMAHTLRFFRKTLKKE